MTQLEQRNLILYFIELSERQGLINNKYTEEKEKLNNVIEEIEKVLEPIGHNQLAIKLDDLTNTVIEITKNLFFEYGKIANNIDEDYVLDYKALE